MWRKYNCLKRQRISRRACTVAAVIWIAVGFAGCGTARDYVEEAQTDAEALPSEMMDSEGKRSVLGANEASSQKAAVKTDAGDTGTAKADDEVAESDSAKTDDVGKDAVVSEAADGVYYDFGPISYDLTDIPAMENELYAAWEGRIYYRQYSDEDMEEGALWAEFSPIADTEKELMCMERDGSVTQVGVDYGCDSMYIAEGRIYSQKLKTQGDAEGMVVYSCALDGSDVREYLSDKKIFDVVGNRIICRLRWSGISWIDAEDGKEHVLIPEDEQYQRAEYLGATEDEVFFYRNTENEDSEWDDLRIYSMDYRGNTRELMSVTMQDYIDCMGAEMEYIADSPLFIPYFQMLGDDLYFSLGTTNGNAYMYSGGPIYSMKKDGSGCEILATSYNEYFYLYDDGKSRSLYCNPREEGWGIPVGDEGMCRITLYGEGREDIILWDAYRPYDEPRVYLVQNPTDSILFYPDHSGVCYVLLSVQECEELAIATHKDGRIVQELEGIEYLDGKLFFTLTDLTYSAEYSLGWRDGYERGRSVCYCKDLKNGKIRLLYEY